MVIISFFTTQVANTEDQVLVVIKICGPLKFLKIVSVLDLEDGLSKVYLVGFEDILERSNKRR